MGKVPTLGTYNIYQTKPTFDFKPGNSLLTPRGSTSAEKIGSPARFENFRWALFGILSAYVPLPSQSLCTSCVLAPSLQGFAEVLYKYYLEEGGFREQLPVVV